MNFDFSSLVTDRLQSDVDQRNAKGTYNAADLNRVTAAMEALDEMFQAYGYHSGYTPIFVASRGGQSGQLPEGYTRLQYIESSGTQWIDTGFKPNQLSRVVMDVNILTQSGWPRAVFGGRNGSTTAVDSFVFWAFAADYFRSDLDTGLLEIDIPPAGRHHIDKNRNTTYVDGAPYTQTNYTFQSNYNLALFGQNDADGIDERLVVMQLYGCQVYDDGVLVRDFIPCESPDGAVGLYDATNGMFYGNAGTGTFAAGPAIQGNGLPVGYTQLEYIQSSGTQYIDTGFIPNQDTRVVCSFELLTDNGGHQVIFGARISSSSGQYLFGYAGHRSPPHWRSDYNTTQSNFPSSIPRSGRYEVDKDGNVTQLDSETVQAGAATFTAVVSMYLFAGNTNGVVENQSSMKLYACQIYDEDAMVRNFVPCTDPDGVVGLYDAVNGMFYANAGTGVFSDGPAVPPEPEPEPGPVLDPYTWYESDIPMQSQMAQYLANLAALRGVLSQVAAEPPTPESMALLTYVEANDIETILLQIEAALTTIGAGFLRAGMPWAVAGGPEIFARNGGTA